MSKLYEKCLEYLKRRNNWEWFIKENHSLYEFTKEEIITLHKSLYNDSKFDRDILSEFKEEWTRIFCKEEIKNIVIESKDWHFKKVMLEFFKLHYDDYEKEIYEILKTFPFELQVSIIKELEFFGKENPQNCEFLTPKIYFHYWNWHQEMDQEIVTSIINNEEIINYFFEHLEQLDRYELPEKLKIIKQSKYYQSLFLKYKIKIYKLFLLGYEKSENEMLEYNALITIVEELLNHENMFFEDITYINSGSFCHVYQLNHLVLKIGRRHKMHEIASSESLAFPILRKEIPALDLYIEGNYLYDTQNITNNDVYAIYKKERQKGRIWLDPKIDNVGRMIYKNDFYDFPLEESTLGIERTFKEEKEIGNLGIIDLDYLWNELEIDWEKITIDKELYSSYEKRYQKELKLKKKRK